MREMHRRLEKLEAEHIVRLGRPEPTGRQAVLLYTACYLLWLLLIALGYLVIWIIWRTALLALLAAFLDETDVDQRMVGSFVYLLSGALMLTGLFVMIMAGEPYLRNGVRKWQLGRRFARLAVPLVILGLLGLGTLIAARTWA